MVTTTSTTIVQNDILREDFRAATSDDINTWGSSLDSSLLSQSQVALGIASSNESKALVLPIVSLYEAFFDRAPDSGGLSYWVNQERGGMTLSQIAAGFATAPEFTTVYGASPTATQFVTALYHNILGRAADATGLAYWVAKLSTMNSTNEAAVALGFTQSAEWIADSTTAIENWLAYAGQTGTYLTVISGLPLAPTFSISDNSTSHQIQEGGTVTFTLVTTNLGQGTQETYNLTGTGLSQVVGSTSGVLTIGADGTASVTVQTVANTINTSNTSLNIVLGNGTTDANAVTIVEATQAVSAPSSVNEGSAINFTITSTGGAPGALAGTTETYTLAAVSGTLAQIPVDERTGTVTLDSTGHAVVTIHTDATVFNSGTNPQFTMTVGNDPSVTVTISEVATQTVTPMVGSSTVSTTAAGNTVNFAVATTGVTGAAVAGTVENWTLTGSAAGQSGTNQVTGGVLSGMVTLASDGTANVTVGTNALIGLINTSNQSLTLNLFNNGSPVTSASVTITEPTATLSDANSHTISEGSTATFNLASTGLAAGTQLAYTLSGDTSQLANPSQATGFLTVGSGGAASLSVATLASLLNSSLSPQALTLTLNGVSGAGATDTVNVTENATISVTAPSSETGGNSVAEGSAVTFTLAASSNVAPGTQVGYTLSGSALGNILVNQQTGTATVSPGGTVTISIGTLANDLSGVVKTLTLTLNNLNNIGGAPTVATANINENAVGSFILTTGTDNGSAPGTAFYGNPVGGNNYFATEFTLGQTDTINAGGGPNNTMWLSTTTAGNVTSFTTTGIQTFDINANNTATTIDMSGAAGVTTVTDDNSSRNITLNNVQAPVTLKIQNPSDFGVPVNATLNYVAGAQGGTQAITLVNSLSPITGFTNTLVTTNGMPTMTISALTGTNNGLAGIVDVATGTSGGLTQLYVTSPSGSGNNFVLGNNANPALVPAGAGVVFQSTGTAANSNILDVTGLSGTFFNIGALVSLGGLTINDPNGFNTTFDSVSGNMTGDGVADTISGLGGGQGGGQGGGEHGGGALIPGDPPANISVNGNLIFNMESGNVVGEQIVDTLSGGTVVIQPLAGGSLGGGFLSSPNAGENPASIVTVSGAVTVQGLTGGLGNTSFGPNNAFILTNTTAGNGGNITISGVSGGIVEQLSNGLGQANISESGMAGNITLDFSTTILGATQTGFHGDLNGLYTRDYFTGGTGTNTLLIDPSINNNTSTYYEGNASGVNILTLQSPTGTNWNPVVGPNTGGGYPTRSFDLGLIGQPNTVNINVTLTNDLATFTDVGSNETFYYNPSNSGTLTSNTTTTGIWSFDFGDYFTSGDKTLSIVIHENQTNSLTIRDFDTTNIYNNPVGAFNFDAYGNNSNFTLTLDQLNALGTLVLSGNSNLIVNDTAAQTATINNIHVTDTYYVNLLGLMTAASTGGVGYSAPAGTGAANALSATGGTILVDNNGYQASIAVGNGSWIITNNVGSSSLLVNPGSTYTDTITMTGGSDTITVGKNGGGSGLVNITTANGANLVQFDQSVTNLVAGDILHLGTGVNDTVQAIDGAVSGQGDALYTNWTGVDIFTLAGGFSNNLVLDSHANTAVTGLPSTFVINTGGTVAHVGSSQINVTSGYNHALVVNVASGGDAGGDSITMYQSPGAGYGNNLTVNTNANDFNVSFEGGSTAIAGGTEGIIANTNATNLLNLTADNQIADIFQGSGPANFKGVQTITGLANGGNSEGIFLVDNAALSTNQVVNLTAIHGTSLVWAQNITSVSGTLTITGGGSGTAFNGGSPYGVDVLVGASAAGNVITANGGATGMSNFIYSPGGHAASETGVHGGYNSGGQVAGTTFIFNSFAESPASQYTGLVPTTDVTITNFNGGNGTNHDIIAINPTALLGGAVTYLGSFANYATAEAQLSVAPANAQAVYEQDNHTLWISNDGELDSTAMQIVINPAQALTLTQADFATTTGTAAIAFSGGSVVYALPSGINAAGLEVTLPVWLNAGSGSNLSLLPGVNLVNPVFVGQGGSITLNNAFTNFNFAALGSGVTATTQGYSAGPTMGAGLLTGTSFNDSFFVNSADLFNNFIVDGDGGVDQITIDPVGPLTIQLNGTGSGSAGVGVVKNVETLNLVDTGGNTISFGTGTAFYNINGSTGPDTINTLNMVAGGTISLTNGGGDTVNLQSGLATTINFGTGAFINHVNVSASVSFVAGTVINGGGGLSATVLTLATGDNISAGTVNNIDNLVFSGSVTMTSEQYTSFGTVNGTGGSDQITLTDAAGTSVNYLTLDGSVETVVLANATNYVTLGAAGQNVTGNSGADTVTDNLGGTTGTLNGDGGSNDTLILGATTIFGNVTNWENLSLVGNGTSVTMTNAQYAQFTSISAPGTGNTITISDAFTHSTVSGVENYILSVGASDHSYTIAAGSVNVTDNDATGSDTATINGSLTGVTLTASAGASYTVHADSGDTNLSITLGNGTNTVTLGGGQSNVSYLGGSGSDSVTLSGAFTGGGSLNGGAGGTNTLTLNGGADISGLTSISNFNLTIANNASVTMSSAEWAQFDGLSVTASGTNTVTIADTSLSILTTNPNVENYILNGSGNDQFQFNIDASPTLPTVSLAGGGNDTVILSGTYTGGQNSPISISNFSPAGTDIDHIQSMAGATNVGSSGFQVVSAVATSITGVGIDSTIVINSGVTNSTVTSANAGDVSNGGTVETILAADIANVTAGTYTAVIYGSGTDVGNAEVYQFSVASSSADLITSNLTVEHVAHLVGVAANSLSYANFV